VLLALSVISAQGPSMGSGAFKIFDARGGSIGRIESNDWPLPDPERWVSSRHAVVRFESGAFCLEDVSTNGTFLNAPDQALAKSEAVRLKDGDRLFIGNYEILVQLIEDRLPAQAGQAAQAPAAVENVVDPLALLGAGAGAAAPGVSALPSGSTPVRALPALASSAEPSAPGTLAGAAELLGALGLDSEEVDAELAGQLGAVVRAVVEGTIDALRARTEAKSNLRMATTSIRPAENNPLKFSLNADDALHNLFVKRHPGYLGPLEAFEEAFQDLAFHQRAVLTAIREAYRAMFEKFSPEHLEEVFTSRQRRSSVIPIGARSKLWDMYCAAFEDMEKDGEASFQNLFGEEFARAYHDELKRLTQASKSRNK
jgi:predicted component of type VI protein secretion system